ncbi:MAG: TolC family protein [Thiomicrorhabdus sp.]|jgi:outer membrane protein TolC|nr:TolC family protein [Thiomicrorhabdus sp.]
MIMQSVKFKRSFLTQKRILSRVLGLVVLSGLHVNAVYAQPKASVENPALVQTASETTPSKVLPEPLTLEYLLSDEYLIQSPQMLLQNARLKQVQSLILTNQTSTDWQANIEGRLGWREYAQESQNHNLLALHLGKVLYDFDQTDLLVLSAQQRLDAEKTLSEAVDNQQRFAIMQGFFNVLLADFQFRIDDEAMAIEYVGFDKVKDRNAIGQLSDVDLLAAESSYQKALVNRMRSESRQLQSRVELVNILHQPNARPGEFTFPSLKRFAKRSLEDLSLEDLQAQVLQESLKLQAISQQLDSQKSNLESALSQGKPTVRADAWAGQLSSYPEIRGGNWRAEISVNIPLYDQGSQAAAVATSQANLAMTEAEYQQLSQSLRAEVTELYFQIKLLQAEKKQHYAFGDYADLYLDYSRALYENEAATDLGDAMVRLSQANYDLVAWKFKQALLWSQIDYLMGKKVGLEQSASAVADGSIVNSLK